MTIRMTRPTHRSFGKSVVILAAGLSAALIASAASAQQAPAPAAPKPPAPKTAPKPPAAAPKPPTAAQQPAQPAAPAPQAMTTLATPNLIYSPWTKLCGKGQDPNAPQVCFTGKDVHLETGMPAVAVVLIEPEGAPQKLFRVTLPLGLSLQHGTRIIVDQQPPVAAPFFTCIVNGCMADYEATPDLVAKMKQGQMLTVQAVNLGNSAISFPLPLADFAKTNQGPPTDPKKFEADQKQRQEDMQKRAEETRKKMEQQQAGQPPK